MTLGELKWWRLFGMYYCVGLGAGTAGFLLMCVVGWWMGHPFPWCKP